MKQLKVFFILLQVFCYFALSGCEEGNSEVGSSTITSASHLSSIESSIVSRGVNYDPNSSRLFQKGVGLNDVSMMKQAIEADLALISQFNKTAGKNMNITHIKTFLTAFSTADGSNSLNIADVVSGWNLKNPATPLQLGLGVYEFRPETDACGDNDRHKLKFKLP